MTFFEAIYVPPKSTAVNIWSAKGVPSNPIRLSLVPTSVLSPICKAPPLPLGTFIINCSGVGRALSGFFESMRYCYRILIDTANFNA